MRFKISLSQCTSCGITYHDLAGWFELEPFGARLSKVIFNYFIVSVRRRSSVGRLTFLILIRYFNNPPILIFVWLLSVFVYKLINFSQSIYSEGIFKARFIEALKLIIIHRLNYEGMS